MIANALLLIQSCAAIFSRNICSVINALGSSKSIFRALFLSNSATTFPFSSTDSFSCLMIALPTALTFGLMHALTISELYVVPCQEKKVLHCSEISSTLEYARLFSLRFLNKLKIPISLTLLSFKIFVNLYQILVFVFFIFVYDICIKQRRCAIYTLVFAR